MDEQNSNQEKTYSCLNCYFPLSNTTHFCPNCGQKNTSGRLSLKELFSQFFDSVFNIDSKIFRTLGAIFIPGKLTNAFLNGQRLKYYHPFRLFLVLIVISLAILNFQDNISTLSNLDIERIESLKERKRLMGVLDKGIQSISEKTNQQSVLESLDTLSTYFNKHSGKQIDSININDALSIMDDFDFNIAVEDFEKYSGQEIIDVYQVKGLYKRLMVQQKVKMIKEGTSFIPFVMGKITWVIFFVMLLLALIFKIFYVTRDILYLEHLIFSIHLNSFFVIIMSILLLLPGETTEVFIPWTILLMAIYLFIAMKRVYKQSYFMTSLKFLLVLFCYFFLTIFGIILTVVGSFLIF